MTRSTITADQRRERREAKIRAALGVVRGIRRPEEPVGKLLHTAVDGPDGAPGFVYFAFCCGRIKIGYTTDVQNRMAALATHSPAPVTLLLTIKGAPEDERKYHKQFDEERENLEWFNLSFRLQDFMERHFVSGTFELLMEARTDHADFVKRDYEIAKEMFATP